MAARQHLFSRLHLVAIVAGTILVVDLGLLAAGSGALERLQVATVVFLVTLSTALAARHRARFGLRSFLLFVPLVAFIATLAGRYGQLMYHRSSTAEQISMIGGSYTAGPAERRYGLVNFGDYYLPEAVVNVFGESAFHDIRSLSVNAQALEGQPVESWRTEELRRLDLITKGDAPWPAREVKSLLSVPNLQRVRVAFPASSDQLELLASGLAGRSVIVDLRLSSLDPAMLEPLQSLQVSSVLLSANGVTLNTETAAAIRDIASLTHLSLSNCVVPGTVGEAFEGLPSVVVRQAKVDVTAVDDIFQAEFVTLRNCVIRPAKSGSQNPRVNFGKSRTTRLVLDSVTVPAELLEQMLRLPSLGSLTIASTPLTPELVTQAATRPSMHHILLNRTGLSDEQVGSLIENAGSARDPAAVGGASEYERRWVRQPSGSYEVARFGGHGG